MSPVSERAAQVRFRRALSLMAMTLVAPGTAQLAAGNRRVGIIAFRTYLVLLVVGGGTLVAVVVHHDLGLKIAFNTGLLLLLKLGLMVLAVGWAALLVDAWRLGNPLSYSVGHRRMSVGVNGLLCFSVAGTLLFGAHLAGVQRDFVVSTFGDGEASGAHDGRFNVLLMGGDAGAGRWGLRPDSINIASIDAETGRTVLIALPRNMSNFPFREGSVMDEQFPDGFDCGAKCELNAVSTWAGDNTELFPDSDHPGVDATIMAVEGITGLRINYWALINLDGFKELVDAVGGVTLNVRQDIPVGLPGDAIYGTIKAGTRKLNGFETLWFARARDGSDDYSRMARQKCVMSALLDQVSPQDALRNFQDIAQASSAMVQTNLPASEVANILSLALKAKGQKIATLSLVPPLVNTGHPDIPLVHRKVTETIAVAEGDAPAARKPRRTKPDTMTGGSLGSYQDGYAANQADDLASTC